MSKGNHSDSLRALRVVVPVEDQKHVAERRQALEALIQKEIASTPARLARKSRRANLQKYALVAAALFGIATAAVFSTTRLLSPDATDMAAHIPAASRSALDVLEGSARVEVYDQNRASLQSLAVGDELRLKAKEHANLLLAGGTSLEFSGRENSATGLAAPSLRLSRAALFDQELYLSSGRLNIDVPERRDSRRRVVIKTPHAQVQVKGTQFSVDVQRLHGKSVTIVRVTRGKVHVTWQSQQKLLSVGEVWRSDAMGQRADAQQLPSEAVEQADLSASAQNSIMQKLPSANKADQRSLVSSQKTHSPSKEQTAKGPLASDLAEQNQLLERAVKAQKQGNLAQAQRLLSDFLNRYPDSPLRSTVLFEQRQVARQLQNSQGSAP